MKVSLLDYGAGNVRSVRNAILAAGFDLETIDTADQIDSAELIVFPGVGAFPAAMERIQPFQEALVRYIRADRPFLGICLGMQLLFESSTEGSGGTTTTTTAGLGIIPGHVVEFDAKKVAVPHIGWNGRILHQESPVMPSSSSSDNDNNDEIQKSVYFVHSFYAPLTEANRDWVLTSTTYGSQRFISSVQKGNVVAMQFHPEKSGQTGLAILRRFLEVRRTMIDASRPPSAVFDSNLNSQNKTYTNSRPPTRCYRRPSPWSRWIPTRLPN
jgi:imidazole glycerol-phosphate synthase